MTTENEEATPEPIETTHSLTLGSRTLNYTATVGMLPVEHDEAKAEIFFTAYTRTDINELNRARPLIFAFNGGPGSSSIWLHLGALGPKRVRMQNEGWMPAPPYHLVPNMSTWLEFADLVFIDPVGTGYSRAADPEKNETFWNLEGDLASVGEFIRLYLTRYERWSSPLFLAGESYGTTRAAGLSAHLIDRGIGLNGIILISTILNFQTVRWAPGNDLPYVLYLPGYTAAAWYHGRLPEDLDTRPLRDVLTEVEAWAQSEYLVALMQGDRITLAERELVVQQLARYTGLTPMYVDQSDLRIPLNLFRKELLRDVALAVGRLDSRFTATEPMPVTDSPKFAPSLMAITPPYTSMLNAYMRQELGYQTDRKYEVLSFDVNQAWAWERGVYPDTSEALRDAMMKNRYMKVFIGSGLYDLATPYFAAEYTLAHMRLGPELRDNIQTAEYPAGHMFYIETESLRQLRTDIEAFVAFAVAL
ncbi:MAG: S10 family peptidase [Anaerolineae bacterium]